MKSSNLKATMMKPLHSISLMVVLLLSTMIWAQPAQKNPHIGYLYPAGGQRGETIRIFAGGQYLRGTKSVLITGEGIEAKVIHCYPPMRNINGDQRKELGRQLWETWEKRRNALPDEIKKNVPTAQAISPVGRTKPKPSDQKNAKLPDNPMFNNIASMDMWQLATVVQEIQNFRKRQQNAQLSEIVEIEIRIAPDADPGDRELRLLTNAVLSNPFCFQVGTLPEVMEQEPNDPVNRIKLPAKPVLQTPVLLNGQIRPGDVDRFSFYGKKDQQIVVNVAARHLIPYLADAVPGWFQAVTAIYDSKGQELAYADDYRFQPDPVLVCTLPEDGNYTLEIRDSIYRGREDFVYRAAVGELPFITRAFPLGGQSGSETLAKVDGYNLTTSALPLDTAPEETVIRKACLNTSIMPSNDVLYEVSNLPESLESEPNDTTEQPQHITTPIIVNGCIDQSGDMDVYAIEGQTGEELVLEVFARRLQSPMDSLVRILDTSGSVLTWNDDHKDKLSEILTHHADSKVQTTLPADGKYFIQVSDAQHNGGKSYAYRLHVRQPQPDFALLVTPSSINIPSGGAVDLCAHVVRQEGFTGPITLALNNAPKGFHINGGRIPADKDSIRFTLSAPARAIAEPLSLDISGSAQIGGEPVSHDVIPAEDMMQAFLPRHLVPSQQLLIAVKPTGLRGQIWRKNPGKPLLVSKNERIPITFNVPGRPKTGKLSFELNEAPEGIIIEDIKLTPKALSFYIAAKKGIPDPGYMDNLIVNISLERPVGRKSKNQKKETIVIGTLPAIPFKVAG